MKFLPAVLCILLTATAGAEDWPAWRGNSGRTGATSEQLAGELHLQWSLHRGAAIPAWPEDPRLQFDASYEPVVMGRTMFLSSPNTDSVAAYDIDSGQRRWRFFAEAPIRFAPVAHDGRLYVGADDGRLYCLGADDGRLIWKVTAAPSPRLAIGSQRLVSVWPVRGGPVLSENRIYFTAGVWPFEGTSIVTVNLAEIDARSAGPDGELAVEHVVTTAIQTQSPQGYLATSGSALFVPCGRGNVMAVDRQQGRSLRPKYDARGKTDYHVMAEGKWMFHGDRIVDINSEALAMSGRRPVADDGEIYFAEKGKAVAYDLNNQTLVETKDRRGKVVQVKQPRQLWQLDDQPLDAVCLKAGGRLYGHHGRTVVAIEASEDAARVVWKHDVDGTPSSMLAAAGKLVVVTKEGGLFCFGEQESKAATHREDQQQPPAANDRWKDKAAQILAREGADNGYCLALGVGSGGLIDELVRQSELRIIVVDPDREKIDALRKRMDDLGLYGSRVVALAGDPLTTYFPPYLANLIVAEDAAPAGNPRLVQAMFQVLRPYGGMMCLDLNAEQQAALESAAAGAAGAEVRRDGSQVLLVRAGALPGSADWTHEFGGAANTLMSKEKLVKAPLGVLWFGGPAADGSLFYDRHEWGPSITVKHGRMFIQGPGKLTAVDVYTGRILWQNEIAKGKSPGRGSNWGPTGYHFVVEDDAFYMTDGSQCLRIDPATGKQAAAFALEDGETWGRIRVWKDQLIGAVFRTTEKDGQRPTKLISVNRHTGERLWSKESEFGFPLVAIGGGRVFCYEGRLEGLYKGDSKERVGGVPKSDTFLYVTALDAASGEQLWRNTTSRAASWVSYSEDHDVLLVSNKHGIDAWKGADGVELWTKEAEGRGFKGHPENYWDKVIIWKDRIIDQRGPGNAYNILTGEAKLAPHPVTGKEAPWTFTKAGHHCNYAIASEHLLTFRAATAGFCDLHSGDTGRLEGFRSGCRNSLIPANGVLNAPNMAHGCVCSFSIFTSLALVHVPQTEFWTYSDQQPSDGPVKRLGINFAAPGDREADDGTLWLDYPSHSAGSPVNVPIKVATDKPSQFRVHSARIQGEGLAWVASSGMRGVRAVTIPLASGDGADAAERTYTVRLYFAEVDAPEGRNVFDVSLQGEPVLTEFDVVSAAGGAGRSVVRQFKAVKAAKELTVSFAALKGRPLISGIELIAE